MSDLTNKVEQLVSICRNHSDFDAIWHRIFQQTGRMTSTEFVFQSMLGDITKINYSQANNHEIHHTILNNLEKMVIHCSTINKNLCHDIVTQINELKTGPAPRPSK